CAKSCSGAFAEAAGRPRRGPAQSPSSIRPSCAGAYRRPGICARWSSRIERGGRPRIVFLDAALAGSHFDRVEDLGVTGATTEISGERLFDLLPRWLGVRSQQGRRAEHHAGLAKPALEGATQIERVLHRVDLVRLRESFNGGEFSALAFDGERDAGKD